MKSESKLLIVGGAGRNVGKTEFVCQMIRKVSSTSEIFALKVSAIFPEEQNDHGDHSGDPTDHYLFEETRRDTRKDTSRMLRAGACRVFYLRSNDEGILNGYEAFKKQLPQDALVVCESNSLVNMVKPGLFILVRATEGIVKDRAKSLLERADLIVVSDGKSGFPELEKIGLDKDKQWVIRN